MSLDRTPAAAKACTAPSTSRLVMRSLKRAATTANRVLSPRRPARTGVLRRGGRPALSRQRGGEGAAPGALRGPGPGGFRGGRRLGADAPPQLPGGGFEGPPL